jgi:pilus assembly protein Flp/PilA
LRQLLEDESGVTAIEYGLIAVVAVATMKTVGTNLSGVFGTVASGLRDGEVLANSSFERGPMPA